MLALDWLPRDFLAGKTAFITGGGSGINLGIARTYGALGANVAICGRSQHRLDAAASLLRSGNALARARLQHVPIRVLDGHARMEEWQLRAFHRDGVSIAQPGIPQQQRAVRMANQKIRSHQGAGMTAVLSGIGEWREIREPGAAAVDRVPAQGSRSGERRGGGKGRDEGCKN